MSELLATFSGAGKVIVPGFNPGTDRKYEVLNDVFVRDVLKFKPAVWYVDHWTEIEGFACRYLSQDPLIAWVNDSESQDPESMSNTISLGGETIACAWSEADVAKWFTPELEGPPEVTYMHVVRFVTKDGARHRLTLSPFKCDLDGDGEEVWARYVHEGVRGALGPLLSDFARLEAIEVHAV